MPEEPRSQRTEQPTPRRRKKAREQGQAPRSPDVPAAAGLVGFLLYAYLAGPAWLERFLAFMRESLTAPAAAMHASPGTLAWPQVAAAFGLLLPPLGALAAAGLAGNLLQGPPPFSLYPLKPDPQRLHPAKNLRRVVSLRQGVELLKGTSKMVLFGAVAGHAAWEVLRASGGAPPAGPRAALAILVRLTATILWRVALVAVAVAALDVLFRRYDFVRNLRMTKREVKEEHRETEGDPLVRGRIRQRQTVLARSRMMREVARATVVVTNPTHLAVALRYEPRELPAPVLVAKGRGRLARRIREIAEAHGVPVLYDPPLARVLYRSVRLGMPIPPALYRAVAEILAVVFSRDGRRVEAAR